MAINYKNAAGTDFDDLFEPYSTTKAGTGGIGNFNNAAGTHLNDLYEDNASGTAAANVSYKNTFGGDIGPQWAEIGSTQSLAWANDSVTTVRIFNPNVSSEYIFDADGGTRKVKVLGGTSDGNDWASDEPSTTNAADWDVDVVSITGSGGTLTGTLSTTGIKTGLGGESAKLARTSYGTSSRVITLRFRVDDGAWSSNYTLTLAADSEA